DNPAGQPNGSFPVSVTVTDTDGGQGTGGTAVQVNNVAPDVTGLTLDHPVIDENGCVTLSGTFADPGTQDGHTVTISWDDGPDDTVLTLDPNVATFSAKHRYLDNPAGQPTYHIGVTVVDKDGGKDTGSIAVEVDNVAPADVSLSVAAVRENDTAHLTGSFTDPGTLDTHQVEIDWGDGSPHTILNLDANVLAVPADPPHLHNPAGQPNGSYAIAVTVTDKDNATATAATTVEVDNVAPSGVTLTQSATVINENDTLTLGRMFTDPGTLDTHTGDI